MTLQEALACTQVNLLPVSYRTKVVSDIGNVELPTRV